MRKLFQIPIRFYQKAISPFLPSSCRFYPTCSSYAHDSIGKHGILKGGYLAVKRILKCNPLHKGGLDPVPEKFSFFVSSENSSEHSACNH